MTKNSSIRISDILEKLIQNKNRSIMEAWKLSIGVDNTVDVFIGISKIDGQLKLIEEFYSAKKRNGTDVFSAIKDIRGFLHYPNMASKVNDFITTHLTDKNIALIRTSEVIFDIQDGENPIEQEKLDEMSTLIDELINDIESIEIDKKLKKLFVKVLCEMKVSLKFYEIEGAPAIEEALVNLICKAKSIIPQGAYKEKTKKFANLTYETIQKTIVQKTSDALIGWLGTIFTDMLK